MWEIENHSPNYSNGMLCHKNSSFANVNKFQSYSFHFGLQTKNKKDFFFHFLIKYKFIESPILIKIIFYTKGVR